jgi:hypothetical protein
MVDSDHYRMADMRTESTRAKRPSEKEVDDLVVAEAEDAAAWDPQVKAPSKESSLSLPRDLVARAAFLARINPRTFNRLGRIFQKRKLGKLIRLATGILYSEQFDLRDCIGRLSTGDEGIHLLRTHVAIQTASTLTEPMTKADLLRAWNQLLSSEERVAEPDFKEIVGLHGDLAEIYWLQKRNSILERKLAGRINEYSYEGMIYRIENAKKGPASNEEREKIRKLAEKIDIAEKELEDYLDEKASQEAAGAAFSRIKEEVEQERRARVDGGPTQDELEAEYQDLLEQIVKISTRKKEDT